MASNLFSPSSLTALRGAGEGAIRLNSMDHDPLSISPHDSSTSPFLTHQNHHLPPRLSSPSPSPTLAPASRLSDSTRLGQSGRRRRRRSTRRPSLPSYENDSYPARVIALAVSILERIKARLPEQYQPFFYVGLWFTLAVVILGLAIGYRSKLFALLEAFASFVKGLGYAGPPIIVAALFVVSFPPLIGYSSLVSLSGYVFGFWQGFLVAYSGALLGSIVCFVLCRKWLKANVRKLMAKNESMKSVVRAVEKRGFKMLLLIRLAPYPFNLMNALISATHIPFFTYFTATAVSLIKLALHVYIGSTLSSLIGTPPPPPPPPTDGDGDPPVPEQPHEDGSKALKIIVMISSMIVAIGVGAYVWNIALKEIESMEQARMERRRKKRESLARQYRHQSAGDEGRGNHQDAPSLVRTVSSDIHSSTEGQSEHQHYRNTMVINSHSHQAPQSESVAEIDLTQSASHSRLELEPGEYFVGGARSSFDEEDDRDGEHDALVTGTSKSGYKAGRVGQGYYGDQFNDDEDFEGEEDSDSDSDDFLDGLDGEEGDDMADEEDEDQDLDDMERGQDDVLDLSAAYDSTYANQGQDGIVDLHDDSSWFSQPSSDAHERW